MGKKILIIVSLILVVSMGLAACAAPVAAPTQAPAAVQPKLKVCQVTDTGGIDDKSFNATAWKGVEDAQEQLGAEAKFLESKEVADFEKNINAFLEEKCDLIVTVGFLLGDATKAASEANPDAKFAIVDYGYEPALNNVVGLGYQTDQAAFLAGYAAAAFTKTGKVGTFGGIPIPTVTIFMKGFAEGVAKYNEVKGTKVEVLGWDLADDTKGLFSNSFDDQQKGKELATSLMDEGADIIMPVAGPVGLGAAAAIKERGNAYLIGVDYDWTISAPEYKDIIFTSVLKAMDLSVFTVAKAVADGAYKGGSYLGTLENKGVGIASFGAFETQVPAELKAELEKLQADIISGALKLK